MHNRFAGRTSQPAHRVGAPGPETKPTVGNQGKGGAAPEATAEVAGAPRTMSKRPWPRGLGWVFLGGWAAIVLSGLLTLLRAALTP